MDQIIEFLSRDLPENYNLREKLESKIHIEKINTIDYFVNALIIVSNNEHKNVNEFNHYDLHQVIKFFCVSAITPDLYNYIDQYYELFINKSIMIELELFDTKNIIRISYNDAIQHMLKLENVCDSIIINLHKYSPINYKENTSIMQLFYVESELIMAIYACAVISHIIDKQKFKHVKSAKY